jgi:hypothetical protein
LFLYPLWLPKAGSARRIGRLYLSLERGSGPGIAR